MAFCDVRLDGLWDGRQGCRARGYACNVVDPSKVFLRGIMYLSVDWSKRLAGKLFFGDSPLLKGRIVSME